MSLTSTLSKKGFASILTKILIQVASKVGNIPWSPKLSSNFAKSYMLIGIDINKDSQNKKKSVVSYCCTLTNDSSKYHSSYEYQDSANKYNERIKNIIAECISAYIQHNKILPK